MPIANKDLGNYKRPGIFIVEDDQSIIERPIQDVLINLVPGFSKKGPVNNPIRVDNPKDFEDIFGPVDINLENKASYFHRTVNDMLQKGPVWALNLLATDPNRDLLEWESISLATQYENGPKNTSPYERFYNRQDFWERDEESFMDLVDEEYADYSTVQPNPALNLLSVTNMGDKKFTLFIFKSSVTGFDVTAESWYGGADKVPLFMNAKDWISDYMISILAINGDWTDYATLSSDSYWGVYFNSNGLIKTKVQDFVNDRLVNVVAYYDASLIPNFRDVNGRDLYVKNLINNNTDKTGLFCYYNEDALLNSDAYKGTVDVIGQTLVGSADKSIDFMSYNGTISESLTYSQKHLDSAGNVFGNYGADMSGTTEWVSGRTAEFTNWYTNIKDDGTDYSYIWKVASIASGVLTITGGTIDTSKTEVGDTIYFNKSFSIVDNATPYYIIDTGNTSITVSTAKGGAAMTGLDSGTTTGIFVYTFKKKVTDATDGYHYQIGSTQYLLEDYTIFFDPFTITNSETTQSRYDVVYLSTDATTLHTVKGTASTSTPSLPNYLQSNTNTIILGYALNTYNAFVGDTATTPTSTHTGVTTTAASGYDYYTASGGYTIVGTTNLANSALTLTFLGTSGSTVYSDYYKLRIQKIFSEISTKILLGKSAIINYKTGYKYNIDSNYFISNATTTSNAYITITFDATHIPSDYYNAGSFLIYYIDDEFVLPTGVSAQIASITTTEAPCHPMISCTYGVAAKYSTFYLAYYNGEINNLDWFYEYNSGSTGNIYYLRMYVDSLRNLTVKFSLNDPAGSTTYITNWVDYQQQLVVYSDKSSWKQTLEIENWDTITDETNTTVIYVDNTRYSEISKGWYLEAWYDTTYYDSPGAGYVLGYFPRKLVRVTSTALDTVDTSLKIIYADGPIKINSGVTSGETYTTAYKSIDNYFTEYNGISLSPFTIHPDSIPNGTDSRLSTILAVLDKNTNLAKGLANKNRISWRYLVDSFGLGLTANSKQEYADLCGAKLNCFGFINMPSARQFKTSTNPSFINTDRTLNTEYVKEGGDLSKNPSFLYSFANGVGMSTVGYFFPYVKDSRDSTNSTRFAPPASKVAMKYMEKFSGGLGGVYPWQIIAGPQFSLMKNITSTEMRFTNEDLENFYSMGANPIIYSLNRGYNINSESSAQVYPLSSLSYIHSREVLIELENRLYDMLLNYHWRFNTPEIRAEIKFRADQICKEFLDTNALYDFKNVCDKTNNTDYIIDLQMGVLDTYVEIIKGMGIIVNNIVILKKGTIQSGGFLPA